MPSKVHKAVEGTPIEEIQRNPAEQVRGSSLSSGGNYKNQELTTDKAGGKSIEGGANKRRSRSHSPPATTKSRQQHTQEIRNSQATGASSTDGITSKWQGVGSPLRRTKDYKSTQDSASMSTDSSLSCKELVLHLGDDKDDNSTDSSMKCDPFVGALGQTRIYMIGTFNLKRYKLMEDIKQCGGQVTSNIKEADLVVVGTDPKEREMEYLKETSTNRTRYPI
jgi:hypothetical protein